MRLVTGEGTEVDRLGWGTALHAEASPAGVPASGKVLSRSSTAVNTDTDNNLADFSNGLLATPVSTGVYEVEIPKDACPNIDGLQTIVPDLYMLDDKNECQLDQCVNLEGLQLDIPVGYRRAADAAACELIPIESRPLLITEILPNAPSYDDGLEFIEIYNPNDSPVSLAGYTLELGPAFSKGYQFTSGEILAGQYLSISDAVSGITLPNTTGSVRLIAPAGNVVSETAAYSEPAEGSSWALLDNTWMFTNQPTPNETNKMPLEVEPEPAVPETVANVVVPCPAGKFRNPDTNRCKSVAVQGASLSECKEGQERNPATNRCRSIVTTASSLKPCDEGQERNPATNRCRKKVPASSDQELAPVKDVYVMSTGTKLNYVLVASLFGCAVIYVLYEWRTEIYRKLTAVRSRDPLYGR